VGFITASNIIVSNNSTTGIASVTNRLHVGNNIGLNTHSPTTEVHIVKNGIGGVHLTSTQESFVGVARSLTRGQLGGELRFGNLSDSFGGQKSLELVNYDLGNLNQYIHRGAAGVGTGNFNWIYGQSQTARMTLTWDGKLGIAKTNPDHELHVVGTSTITDDLYIGDDLFVKGDSTLTGDLSVNGVFTTNNLSVPGGINANLNSASGVSTFFNINVTNQGKLAKIAIGTDQTDYPIQIGDAQSNDVIILSGASFIGIGTTLPTAEVNISAQDASVIIRAVGVGTTRPRAAVDFYDAGRGYFSEAYRYLLPPKVSTPERNNLATFDASTVGAIIYNSTSGNLETWVGNTWVSLANTSITPRANFASVAGISSATPFVIDLNPLTGNLFPNFAKIHDLEIYQFPTNSVGCVTSYGAPFLLGNSVGVGTTTTGTTGQLLQVSGGVYISGNTGIGTTNPKNNLDVVGNVSITGVVTTATRLEVGTGVTISAGIVTATNGFLSGIGTAVKITTSGDQLIFTVPGVGSTSFTLS